MRPDHRPFPSGKGDRASGGGSLNQKSRLARLAWHVLTAIIVTLTAPVAAAQPVISPAAYTTAVTLYRNPFGGSINPDNPDGLALITETRRVALPAGRSTLRLEGVASGLVVPSVVIAGLPGNLAEKNRDAKLLSPATLIDAFLDQPVELRRTSPATGRMSTIAAIVRAGPGRVVLETADGIEALDCSALPEAIIYPRVPASLADRPTLSVEIDSPEATTADITLSYLSIGFGWTANYVLTLPDDGGAADLTAWLTLVNAGDFSIADAEVMAVAGRIERDEGALLALQQDLRELAAVRSRGVWQRCWPGDVTSTHPRYDYRRLPFPEAMGRYEQPVPPPPPPPPPAFAPAALDSIVVTGSRIARQEELGDLKLYRLPERTALPAQSQKQVMFAVKEGVAFERIYRVDSNADASREDFSRAQVELRADNDLDGPLGLPLPVGRVAIFEEGRRGPLLLGEDDVLDTAIGEEFKVSPGEANDVLWQLLRTDVREDRSDYRLEITNARSAPVRVEVSLGKAFETRITRVRPRAEQTGDQIKWIIDVPANGRKRLTYRATR